jgi:hypothetical protein
MDGTQATDAAGGHLGAATVIIQDTVVRTSRFLEYGVPPPYAQSTGSGTAVVLRDGRAWRVHWSRPDPDSGTTYTLPSGAGMTFAPVRYGSSSPRRTGRRPDSRDCQATFRLPWQQQLRLAIATPTA